MKIPLLDLDLQYQSIKEEISIVVNEVLESQNFVMGEAVKSFEKEIARYCDTDFAFGCASGSDALLLALMAIDIQPGDYVITSPFTFFATAGAISRLGAIPVFIDIEADSFNIDPVKVEQFLNGESPLYKRLQPNRDKIKAVIPVHLYGQLTDMTTIMKLAERYNLSVIEDAAQSIGAKQKGIQAGNFGDFGCFSFFPSKNLGAYGDAGLITVKDPELAQKTNYLRLHGAHPKYYHKYVGINSRLDSIQAAILSVKLQYLDSWSDERRIKALEYNRLFTEAGLVSTNYDVEAGIIIPIETTGNPDKDGRHIYHQYTLRVNRRDELQSYLTECGIGTSIYYPVPLHQQECFAELNYTPEDCAQALKASSEVLSIPIYPELSVSQQEYIVDKIAEFYAS